MATPRSDFDISTPAWRIRRLRSHLAAQTEAGRAARGAGEARAAPPELTHRAEARRWLNGWDRSDGDAALGSSRAPTERQIAKLARWQAGAGRLRPAQGDQRRVILETVADELLSTRPPAFGAIAAAHRETVRRCREAGLPGPKASRYRKWLKVSRGI